MSSPPVQQKDVNTPLCGQLSQGSAVTGGDTLGLFRNEMKLSANCKLLSVTKVSTEPSANAHGVTVHRNMAIANIDDVTGRNYLLPIKQRLVCIS